jgi:predicted RNase H-like nuclease
VTAGRRHVPVSELAGSGTCLIAGIDLAWGERMSDGVCLIGLKEGRAQVRGFAYPHGDDALMDLLSQARRPGEGVFAAVDAPLVCPNATGCRPVDRLTHRLFHREHAACHPANTTRCPRPTRVRRRLEGLGFTAGWDPDLALAGGRVAAEVYPHPAQVRLFGLPRILKYKRGPVVARRREFRRYQRLLSALLAADFAFLAPDPGVIELLGCAWTKPVEDRTDALFCALIGLRHLVHRGAASEVIGDVDTGFILLPAVRTKKRAGSEGTPPGKGTD